ncbi:putative CA-responsive protein [Senna tora]|uniref:Putative CA-responsive protein n=1 Tax=Senna tora TaxID=362788 RepID=A0A834XHR9_9FABA|nr:putative CA-responsive protein [Senna tora]
MHDPIFWFALLIFSASLLSFILTSLSVYKKLQRKGKPQNSDSTNSDPAASVKHSASAAEVVDKSNETDDPSHLTRSLLLEVLPSDSAKWASLFDEKGCDAAANNREVTDEGQIGKKKKRKAKKKKMSSHGEDEVGGGGGKANAGSESGLRLDSVCLYPFTSSSSAMQRKIKQQYDELVKCHEAKKLTLHQVVQFANSLVDARSELQHKADAIQRKFVITKALLFKADRSSFDRLRQQIYKLELEQKRLEEDAFVYNWLQEQLKLSPAYKKMLEVGTCMEKAKSCKLGEEDDDEFCDISFEELLAQEKKDSFWQKTAKSRQCSS